LQFFHGTHGGIGCAHVAGVGYDEYRQDFVFGSFGNNPDFFPTIARVDFLLCCPVIFISTNLFTLPLTLAAAATSLIRTKLLVAAAGKKSASAMLAYLFFHRYSPESVTLKS